MNRAKLIKCKSLIAYVRNSVDLPGYSSILPVAGKNKDEFIIRKCCSSSEANLLNNLLSTEAAQVSSKTFCGLIDFGNFEHWTALIASPFDMLNNLVGFLIYVNIPQNRCVYIAGLYVKINYRGKKLGKQLFDTFYKSVDADQTVLCYDCQKMDKLYVYPTLLPEKGERQLRVCGYVQNILIACEKFIGEQRRAKQTRLSTISKICVIPTEVDVNKVCSFDEMVCGKSRQRILEKLLGFGSIVGLVSINQSGEIYGYGLVTMEGKRRRPIIGPIYARTLFAAVHLTYSLCSVVDNYSEVILNVPFENSPMLNFLTEDAESEIIKTFVRQYSQPHKQLNDTTSDSMIYAYSSHFLLPEC